MATGGFSLLRENQILFWGMKLLAAGYLLYVGSMLIKASEQSLSTEEAFERESHPVSFKQMFARGFLSAALNPKNAIFYLSLMALLVSKETPLRVQAVYGVWMFSLVLAWDVLVAAMIGNTQVQSSRQTYLATRTSFGSHVDTCRGFYCAE